MFNQWMILIMKKKFYNRKKIETFLSFFKDENCGWIPIKVKIARKKSKWGIWVKPCLH